jgi:colanic acid biosynthesis glycosyl transferase WcaI
VQLTDDAPPDRRVPQRVLVVGINFEPEQTGIAPYTTGVVDHLVAQGHDVTILTGVPHYPQWSVPVAYRRRLRFDEETPGRHVIRLRHFVPARQSAVSRAWYEATFLARVLMARLDRPYDVVLGVTPSLGGVVGAAVLARLGNVPFAAIVQDLVGKAAEQTGIDKGSSVAGITARVEGWALQRARRIGVVTPSFLDDMAQLGAADRTQLVRNWSRVGRPDQRRDTVRQRLGWDDGVTVALHTGNMGLKQDLDNVIEAARATPEDARILFVIMGEGSQREALVQRADGVANLRFMDLVPDGDYANVLGAADVLLVNQRPSVRGMSLPSKLSSYFAAGRPVVAAVDLNDAAAIEVQRAQAGIVVPPGQPLSIVEAVRHFRSHPVEAAAFGARGRDYAASDLSMAASMAQLENLLANAYTAAPPRPEKQPLPEARVSEATLSEAVHLART